ncbi:MAG: tetratricopeptide repeat protein [Chloroflexota bacterium]
MSKVSLRAYNREIEGLIEQGHRLDEAVAHCRHILKTYPKHLDTYRLLGKVYLEAKRYDQAVDIFQRVLVAAPEDFVSHVGMSIIADDQGKLDDAIWHMERAFEVQPSNAAIQAELQRLFGRRDGVEPPKIRLTRGALAHMYVQGELYTQAIAEIRAVLAHDQNRTDMQVLLARAYLRNGQKAEAADVCSGLLGISPYCLDPNRLMAEIHPAAQATEATREYRRRVFELDPYAEFAKGSVFGTDTVADGAVTLQRLEYTGQPAESGGALGMDLKPALGAVDRAASPPIWMASAPDVGTGLESAEEGTHAVPDFIAGAGWREADAISSSAAGTGEAESGFEPAVAPADLPEWVRALAPSDESGRELGAGESTGQAPDWAREAEGAAPAASAVGDDSGHETPDWLRDLAMGAQEPSQAPVAARRAQEKDASSTAPDIGARSSTPAIQDDALAWLEGLAEKHGAKPEELLTSPDARPSTPPQWVNEAPQKAPSSGEGWRPINEGLGASGEGTTRDVEAAAQAPDQKSFDWLSGLSDQNTFTPIEEQTEAGQAPIMEEREPARWPKPGLGAAVGDLPDWLGANQAPPGEKESPFARELSGEYESAVDLPDWLADLDAEKPGALAVAGQEPPSESLPDWLQAAGEAVPAGEWRPAEPNIAPPGQVTMAGKPPGAGRDAMSSSSLEPVAGPQPEHVRQTAEPLPARIRPVPSVAKLGVPSLGGAQAELGRGNIAAALDMYGQLIRKGRSLEEIIRDLRDALYRYPVEVPIWQALGDAYMRGNRLQEALDAYTKAEELLR